MITSPQLRDVSSKYTNPIFHQTDTKIRKVTQVKNTLVHIQDKKEFPLNKITEFSLLMQRICPQTFLQEN